MQFRIRQNFEATPIEMMHVYTDPEFYPYLHNLPKIGAPEVLDRRDEGGQVLMWVRYLFRGDLPVAARWVLDPSKLTWIEAARYDFESLTAWTQLLPDNYADKMTCSATVVFSRDPGPQRKSTRTIDGDLKVSMPLVGGKVEHAIVSGLREHMTDERPIADWWAANLRDRAAGGEAAPEPATPETPPPASPGAYRARQSGSPHPGGTVTTTTVGSASASTCSTA